MSLSPRLTLATDMFAGNGNGALDAGKLFIGKGYELG